MTEEIITLDYGSGGKKTSRLIEELLVPAFSNPALDSLGDGAIVEGGAQLTFSTDSFVVDPIFFPGGDIGKLAVCGTVNDLAVCGAEPKYLSCALILEEGLPMDDLKRVVDSIRSAAEHAGVQIVTGDTKVVEKGIPRPQPEKYPGGGRGARLRHRRRPRHCRHAGEKRHDAGGAEIRLRGAEYPVQSDP